jgi:hypothetical protein
MAKRGQNPKPKSKTDTPRRAGPVAPARPGTGRILARTAVLGAALLLTLASSCRLIHTWSRLPAPSLNRFNWGAAQRAPLPARGPAAEGWIAFVLSSHVTRTVHDPRQLPERLADARLALSRQRASKLGRLQVAALAMLRLEHDGVPPEDWWPQVAPYFENLDDAPFDHFTDALINAKAAIYAQHGLRPGLARGIAVRNLGFEHGPFLQRFARQMQELEAALSTSGDAENARRCRKLRRRLLRQWVLDPAPAGLRLNAAHLLAEELETPNAGQDQAKLARALRRWRHNLRSTLQSVPLPAALDPTGIPNPLIVAAARPAGAALARLLLATGMMLAACASSLLVGFFWVRSPAPGQCLWRLGAVLVVFVLCVAVSAVLIAELPVLVENDLIRLSTDQAGWPRLPLIGAAIGVVAVLGGTLIGVVIRRPRGAWLPAAGFSATLLCLLLGLGVLGSATLVHRELDALDAAMALPSGYDVPPNVQHVTRRELAHLRAWAP